MHNIRSRQIGSTITDSNIIYIVVIASELIFKCGDIYTLAAFHQTSMACHPTKQDSATSEQIPPRNEDTNQ
jgi:hypothetical protein